MTVLYWHLGEDEAATSFVLSNLKQHSADPSHILVRPPLIVVENPDEGVLALTLDLIARRSLRSAAYMAKALPDDLLWVPGEWWHFLVASPELAATVGKLGGLIQPDKRRSESPPLDIFKPLMKSRYIIGGRPVAIDQVLEAPSQYFGEFADPDIGGANALYAAGIEAANAEGLSDQIIVAGPEALGFKVDEGEEGIVSWRQKGVIAAHAVGFSLGSSSDLGEFFAMHELKFDAAAHLEQAMGWREKGIQFGIGLILEGLEDPPVVIPTGAVFQQPVMGANQQNLAIAQGASAMVAAGATVPIILPAWCLNPTFHPPSGPMTATPLVSTSAGGSQGDVWSRIRTRYGTQP